LNYLDGDVIPTPSVSSASGPLNKLAYVSELISCHKSITQILMKFYHFNQLYAQTTKHFTWIRDENFRCDLPVEEIPML